MATIPDAGFEQDVFDPHRHARPNLDIDRYPASGARSKISVN
jgi:hypothetical protein